jgi:small-conductance mechanosensitive channel
VHFRRPLVLTVAVLLFGLVTAAQQDGSDQALDTDVRTAPVELDHAVLFRVRGTSSYPADVRARQVSERLEEVARNRRVAIDSLHIVERGGVVQIVAGSEPLATFVEADARLEQVRLIELALVHLHRIQEAVTEYRRARSPAALRAAAARTAGATLVFGVVVFGLLWGGRRADAWLADRLRPRFHAIEFRSFTLLRAERLVAALRGVFTIVRAAAAVGIVLTYLSYAFAQFPWTRHLSGNLVALVFRPMAVVAARLIARIPDLFFLAILFFLCRMLLRLIRLFFEHVRSGRITVAGFDPDWAQPTYNLTRAAIVVFALVVAYPYIPGSGSEAFKGITLLLGVVLSLGSSSAVANLVAGYLMTYRRAFKIGDCVTIGSATGDVIAMRIQVTHLRSYTNEEIIIPNSQILTSNVINYSSLARTSGLILHTEVTIGYDVVWRQAEELLTTAAARTAGVLATPRPFVRVKKLSPSTVTYELHAYCSDVHAMGDIYSGLHRSILDVFHDRGVRI